MNEVTTVLRERGSKYGEFKDVAEVTDTICKALKLDEPHRYTHSQKVGMFMIANKLARVACGDPMYRDNYVDIQGYAQLILTEVDKYHATEEEETDALFQSL